MCLLRFAQILRLFLLLSSQTWNETAASSGIYFQTKIERGCKSCYFFAKVLIYDFFLSSCLINWHPHTVTYSDALTTAVCDSYTITMKPPLLSDFRLYWNTCNNSCRAVQSHVGWNDQRCDTAEMLDRFTRSAGDIFEMINWWVFFSKHGFRFISF